MSRTFEDKRMGRPAVVEEFNPVDQKEFDDKMALQLMQYRAHNLDQKLVVLGKKLIDGVFPDDFDMVELSLKHEVCSCYLHGPAMAMQYRRMPTDRYHTGRNRPQWYSIPELPIEKCQMVLHKFGLIKE